MLASLSDMGLSAMICAEYSVTREDLELLLCITHEEAELQREIDELNRINNR
jgi:hypothetical protein